MSKLIETISGISNQWSLSAFAIAAILLLLARRKGKVPPIVWAAVVAIVVVGLAPMLLSTYSAAIYRVRVIVLGADGIPVEDAKVWSSVGGEPKRVDGGWEFDIPAATRPAGGKLTVYAARPSAFLTGKTELTLSDDHNPSALVQLARDTSANVRGVVVDASGRAVAGARVSVEGHEADAVVTRAGGNFVLPAHAAPGQQVWLRAERDGYAPERIIHPAGDEPATLILKSP